MTRPAAAGTAAAEAQNRQLMLLCLVADEAQAPIEKFPLDRVRMQKAGFLLSMRGPGRWRGIYTYRPYDWGPYSDDLTADLRVLQASHLVTVKAGTRKYNSHATTQYGQQIATSLWQQLDAREQNFVCEVRAYVTQRTFNELLTEVYAAYPDYAVKSKFAGRDNA